MSWVTQIISQVPQGFWSLHLPGANWEKAKFILVSFLPLMVPVTKYLHHQSYPVEAGFGLLFARENGNLLQYSCLENSVDRGAWQATGHGVTKNQTRQSTCAHTYADAM